MDHITKLQLRTQTTAQLAQQLLYSRVYKVGKFTVFPTTITLSSFRFQAPKILIVCYAVRTSRFSVPQNDTNCHKRFYGKRLASRLSLVYFLRNSSLVAMRFGAGFLDTLIENSCMYVGFVSVRYEKTHQDSDTPFILQLIIHKHCTKKTQFDAEAA